MKNLELSSSKLPISNNKKCGKNTNYSKVEIISNKITEYFNLTKLSFFPLLLVSMGFILLMIPCFLLGSYNLHLLKFTSMYFLSSPILMVVTSSLHIATALLLFALVIRQTDKILPTIIFIIFILMVIHITVLVLTICLITSMGDSVNKMNISEELSEARNDKMYMSYWDNLQERFQCCGGRGHSGYLDWSQDGGNYPDSCCSVKYEGCGSGAREAVIPRLNLRGCVTILRKFLTDLVKPSLESWIAVATILLITDIVLFIVLVSHWIAENAR